MSSYGSMVPLSGLHIGCMVQHCYLLASEHMVPLSVLHTLVLLCRPGYSSVVGLQCLRPTVDSIIWMCIWCLGLGVWSRLASVRGLMSGVQASSCSMVRCLESSTHDPTSHVRPWQLVSAIHVLGFCYGTVAQLGVWVLLLGPLVLGFVVWLCVQGRIGQSRFQDV